MANKQSTWKIGLYVCYDPFKPQQRISGDRPTWTVEIRPVTIGDHPSSYTDTIDPTRVTNPNDRTDYNGLMLQDFVITTYVSDEADGTRRTWGWSKGYRSPYSVDTRDAERMAKTLKTIDRRMEAQRATDGYPDNFIAYVRHIAKAMKAEAIVFATNRGGWSYSETPHAICNLGEGLDRLRHRFAQFIAEKENDKATA